MHSEAGRVGEVVAGRYRLERLLGAGGMGEVYVAIQEPLGRKVALKLMRPGLTAAASARFEREAKSLAQTPHPNIVTLFDFGRTDDGELFMAMELLPGQSLRERRAAVGRLLTKDAVRVVRDICRALDATHKAGIVHRDLKPENVMLVTVGADEVVKVLDFGIARLQESSDDAARITKTGYLLGTPGYMAPEMVLEGIFDDPRSDLYAVGVILWELLTSYALFSAPTPVALVMRHAQEPPPTLSSVSSPTQPPHPTLQTLVSTLLAKDRRERFDSAQAVIDAIDSLPPEAFQPFALLGAPPLAAAPTLVRSPAPSRGSNDLQPHEATVGDSRMALATPAALTATTPPPSAPQLAMPPSPSSSSVRMAAISAAVVVVIGLVVLALWRGRDVTPAPPSVPVLAPPTPTPTPPPAPVPDLVTPPAFVPPAPPTEATPTEPPSPSPARPPKPKPKPKPKPSPTAPPQVPHVPDLT